MYITIPSLKLKNIPIQDCSQEHLQDEDITKHIITAFLQKEKLRIIVKDKSISGSTKFTTLLDVEIEIKITAKGAKNE